MNVSKNTNETLLEISTRPYLYYLSQKYKSPIKKLSLIPMEELDFFQNLGFNMIWFMGVWNNGTEGRKFDLNDESRIKHYNQHLPNWSKDDVIGSPYSIYSYDPSPEIGNLEDLKWLKNELNKRSIKLILDFVPNHSSMDAPEIKSHPEYYIRKGRLKSKIKLTEEDNKYIYNGKKIEKIPKEEKYDKNGFAYGRGLGVKHPWKDVRQYDYSNKELWKFQLNNLKKIAQCCDGIRCDVAWLMISDIFKRCFKTMNDTKEEFWTFAISEIRKIYPNIIFIAEVFGKKWISDFLLQCGFNFVYDIEPYDILNLIKDNNININEFIERNKNIEKDYLFNTVHFSENHDLITIIEKLEENVNKANLLTAIVCFLPGIKMFNYGQIFGWKDTLCVQLRRILSYEINNEVFNFYTKVIKILNLDVVKKGKFRISLNQHLINIKWYNDKEILIGYFNYNEHSNKGKLVIDGIDEIKNKKFEVKDLIENKLCETYINNNNCIDFKIESYQMKIYLISLINEI